MQILSMYKMYKNCENFEFLTLIFNFIYRQPVNIICYIFPIINNVRTFTFLQLFELFPTKSYTSCLYIPSVLFNRAQKIRLIVYYVCVYCVCEINFVLLNLRKIFHNLTIVKTIKNCSMPLW